MAKFYCQNYGDRPGCLGEVDERYTMDFTDVEPDAFIRWCSVCGPEAHGMQAAISRAFKERPDFQEQFEAAIKEAQRREREGAS